MREETREKGMAETVLGSHSGDIGYFEQIGDLGNLGNSNRLLVEGVERQKEREVERSLGMAEMVLGFHSDDIGYFEQIGDLGNLGSSNHLLVEVEQ